MAFCSPVIFSDLAKVARSCIHALGDDSWPLWGLGNPGRTRRSNEADVIRVVPYLTYASEGSQVWLRPCHRDLCMVDQPDWWSPLGQVDKCILCFFKGIWLRPADWWNWHEINHIGSICIGKCHSVVDYMEPGISLILKIWALIVGSTYWDHDHQARCDEKHL